MLRSDHRTLSAITAKRDALLKTTFRLLVALLTLSSVSAVAQQKSLADIAREEEQRRQAITERSRVYTNDDLSPDGATRIQGSNARTAATSSTAGSTQATAPATPAPAAQSCGPETTRSDGSGGRVVVQTCGDSIRESGTTSAGTTWQNTILPDGSQYGSNSCGVQWKYDGRTTHYETSHGESGLGERIFRANVERINRCKTTSTVPDIYR